ncbi:MAG: leucyl aminopeptidase [Thermoplasmata archaeon]|nr:leucyl aminopeptidase [Thermoplasmata archaeon]
MRFALERRAALASDADVIAFGVPERTESSPNLPRTLTDADRALSGVLGSAWKRGELKGKRKETTLFHRADGHRRVLLVGLGARAAIEVETLRRAAAEAVRALKGRGASSLAFDLPSFLAPGVRPEDAVAALSEGAGLGVYEFRRYRSARESEIETVTIHPGRAASSKLRSAIEHARTFVDAVNWTREIANLPADTATPEHLAEGARKLGRELGLKVTVLDERKLAELHCGGILGVGGGSVHPPRLVIVEYAGRGKAPSTVAVVGKGITFDSGGISIKPALHLADMKFDKSGACAVLGILRAAAMLRVRPRVVGVLACAENLPGGSAYRPGDVVTTYSGKTIEILNTDAEGRVVLADALGYVVDRYKPDTVIDLATLTGACVTALGDDTAGLISTNDALAKGLLAASARTGEPIWRLPLTEFHRELVKSDIADVRNSTEIPPAGALTASAFLETFVGRTTPWAHLDIAGPAWTNGSTRRYQPSYQPVGATAFGVRLVSRYLEDRPR